MKGLELLTVLKAFKAPNHKYIQYMLTSTGMFRLKIKVPNVKLYMTFAPGRYLFLSVQEYGRF